MTSGRRRAPSGDALKCSVYTYITGMASFRPAGIRCLPLDNDIHIPSGRQRIIIMLRGKFARNRCPLASVRHR